MNKEPINIVICYSYLGGPPVSEELQKKIKAVSSRIRLWDITSLVRDEVQGEEGARGKIDEIFAEADIYCGFYIKDIALRAPKLKWLQSANAGVDQVLTPEFIASPIILTKATIHDKQISESVFGYILLLARHFLDHFRAQEKHERARTMPVILHRKTIGIIGLGNIGRRVAYLAKAFGMKVIATRAHPERRNPNVDVILPPAGLHELLKQSDFVVDLLPLSKETRDLIGETELRMMKPTAFLVNVGRGGTINTEALIRALKENWIAGAGLDVLGSDPGPVPEEVWELENVIITPHVTGQRPDYAELLNQQFCYNLRRYLKGQELINLVDKNSSYFAP